MAVCFLQPRKNIKEILLFSVHHFLCVRLNMPTHVPYINIYSLQNEMDLIGIICFKIDRNIEVAESIKHYCSETDKLVLVQAHGIRRPIII